MYTSDGGKEVIIVEGMIARVGQGYFIKYVVPVQDSMVETGLKLRMASCLEEGPDQTSKSFQFHIVDTKTPRD